MDEHTEHTGQSHPNIAQTRVTVAEAAQLLGLSAEAVRSRVQRGTLKSTKVGNTVYVLLDDPAQTRPNTDEDTARTGAQAHPNVDQTEYIASMQDQIDTLKRELEDRKEEARRKDAILMTLAQRVPELEAAPEARESPVTSSEQQGSSGTARPDDGEMQKRSWWKRFFGVE
jgi:excisionase family DNA binding protein